MEGQFSSVAQSRLCDPMDRSMPGLPVRQQLLEFTQVDVHCHVMCFSPPAYVCSGDAKPPHVAATLKCMAAAAAAVDSVSDSNATRTS